MKRNAPGGHGVWSAETPDETERSGMDWQPQEDGTRQSVGVRLVPLMLCAILLVVLLVEGVFFWAQGQTLRRENAVYVPNAAQTVYPADEDFAFGPRQRTLRVSGQAEDLGRMEGTEEATTLVRVALTIGAMDEAVWDCSGAFYLQVDGVYYRNVDAYQLEESDPALAMRALNGYELFDTGMEEGWVYFLVPRSATGGTFWAHWLEKDERYHTSAVQADEVEVEFVQEVTGNA